MSINTDKFSLELRQKSVRVEERRLLVTNYNGTEQAKDLSVPANCDGFGRVRHFRRKTAAGWPENPLPIDPVAKALKLERGDVLRAQAFQNAACNWRCWYCFVPFDLLSANEQFSKWLSADEIVGLYAREANRPCMIDLTGGQPDLVPEWVPWMMSALEAHGLADQVYLWSDDNLSNDYFWRFLSSQDHERIAAYRNYGRVCCFKGFDAQSFAFNTEAAEDLFDRQFALFRRFFDMGLDLYAYVTLTGPTAATVIEAIPRFVDRLQAIHENLPLRTVPLQISTIFAAVKPRLDAACQEAMNVQERAIEAWNSEIARRFSADMRKCAITEVPFRFNRV